MEDNNSKWRETREGHQRTYPSTAGARRGDGRSRTVDRALGVWRAAGGTMKVRGHFRQSTAIGMQLRGKQVIWVLLDGDSRQETWKRDGLGDGWCWLGGHWSGYGRRRGAERAIVSVRARPQRTRPCGAWPGNPRSGRNRRDLVWGRFIARASLAAQCAVDRAMGDLISAAGTWKFFAGLRPQGARRVRSVCITPARGDPVLGVKCCSALIGGSLCWERPSPARGVCPCFGQY